MDPWPKGIAAITLFVEDPDAARRFYQEVSSSRVRPISTDLVFLYPSPNGRSPSQTRVTPAVCGHSTSGDMTRKEALCAR